MSSEQGFYELTQAYIKIAALEAQLKALDWTPITTGNLPTVKDEVGGESDSSTNSWTSRAVTYGDVRTRTFAEDWVNVGWTHFRPINPPHAGVSTGDAGTDKSA
jgi:hypothetical protein